MYDIDSIANLINEEAIKDLTNGMVIEPLTVKLVDNDETNKKIEEKRKFVSLDTGANTSYGLKQSQPQEYTATGTSGASNPKPSTSTSTSSSSSTSTGYGYGYTYQKPAETMETKAKEYSSRVLKRAANGITYERKQEQEQKKQWNIFELEEKNTSTKTVKNLPPKEKLKVERHDAIKIALIRSVLGTCKAVIETLYLKLK